MRFSWTMAAWILVGLLVLATSLSGLGRRDLEADPDPTSTGPSGTSILAGMLRRTGLEVVVDRGSRPRLGPGDVAIAFAQRKDAQVAVAEQDPTEKTWQELTRFATDGGTVLLLPYSKSFIRVSRDLLETEAVQARRLGSRAQVQVLLPADSETTLVGELFPTASMPTPIVENSSRSVADVRALGRGQILSLADGAVATNRFIDRFDHALLLHSLLSSSLGKGGRIVFTTATFGNVRDPSLTSRIGRWAVVAWYQLLFVLLTIVVTLGIRFGLPETRRTPQRGSRDLAEAQAELMSRGHKLESALAASVANSEASIRALFKVPRDASIAERDRLLPERLRDALSEAETIVKQPQVSQSEALRAIQRLEREASEAKGR